jgi:hypothetical protein
MIEITCSYCDEKVFTDKIFNNATIAKISELAQINGRIFCKECYEKEIIKQNIHKCPICGAEPFVNTPPSYWDYTIKCVNANHEISITGDSLEHVINEWNNAVKGKFVND